MLHSYISVNPCVTLHWMLHSISLYHLQRCSFKPYSIPACLVTLLQANHHSHMTVTPLCQAMLHSLIAYCSVYHCGVRWSFCHHKLSDITTQITRLRSFCFNITIIYSVILIKAMLHSHMSYYTYESPSSHVTLPHDLQHFLWLSFKPWHTSIPLMSGVTLKYQ